MDELMTDFYKRHPLAIRSIPSPLIIRSVNMSSPLNPPTSLSECIKDAPAPLPLADRLSSPPPSLHASPMVENLPLVSIDTRPPS